MDQQILQPDPSSLADGGEWIEKENAEEQVVHSADGQVTDQKLDSYSRGVRSTTPIPVTPAQQAVLVDLARRRYLTAQQIGRRFFSSDRLARRALARMVARGLVARSRSDASAQAGFTAWVYYLTAAGAREVRSLGLARVSSLRPPTRPPQSTGFLAHHLLVADFHAWIEEACLETRGAVQAHLVPYFEESRLSGVRRHRVAIDVPQVGGTLCPDLVACLDARGRAALFCVEVDRGTEPLRGRHSSSIERKLRAYLAAFDGEAYAQYSRIFQRSFTGFRVLCSVPTRRRADGFLELAAELDLVPLVWVAEHATLQVRASLAARVWRRETGSEPCSLLE